MAKRELEQFNTEKDKSHPRVRVLIAESIQDGVRIFEPLLINERTDDPLSRLVHREITELQNHLKMRRKAIQDLGSRKPDSRGHIPSLRKIRDDRLDLLSDIVRSEILLKTLKGEHLQPVRILKKGDDPIEIVLTNFGTRGEYRQAREISLDVTELVDRFPEGLSLLVEGFRWKSKIIYARTEDDKIEAKAGYTGFVERYKQKVPQDKEELLKPFMKIISTVFSDN